MRRSAYIIPKIALLADAFDILANMGVDILFEEQTSPKISFCRGGIVLSYYSVRSAIDGSIFPYVAKILPGASSSEDAVKIHLKPYFLSPFKRFKWAFTAYEGEMLTAVPLTERKKDSFQIEPMNVRSMNPVPTHHVYLGKNDIIRFWSHGTNSATEARDFSHFLKIILFNEVFPSVSLSNDTTYRKIIQEMENLRLHSKNLKDKVVEAIELKRNWIPIGNV